MTYEYQTYKLRPNELDKVLTEMGSAGWRLVQCFDIADRDSLPEYLTIFEKSAVPTERAERVCTCTNRDRHGLPNPNPAAHGDGCALADPLLAQTEGGWRCTNCTQRNSDWKMPCIGCGKVFPPPPDRGTAGPQRLL